MRLKCLFSLVLCLAILFTVLDSLLGFFTPEGEILEVPSYLGLREDELPASGEIRLVCSYRHDETEQGRVIAQSPPAGARQKASARRPCEVTLTVSLGVERKTLPTLVGSDVRHAEAALRELGFSVQTVKVEGERAGRVISMQPPEMTSLAVGDCVTLSFEGGNAEASATVPMLVGMTVEEASFALYLAGLRTGEVRFASEGGTDGEGSTNASERTVLRQLPTAGSYVERGQGVTLIVG